MRPRPLPDQNTVKSATLRTPNFLRRFARDEDGTLIVFAVYIFILILMVGGIGIDLMRFERDRSELQATLDRAVLAAADLDQTLDPQDVVNDYFNKAGLGEYLTSITVDQGLSYRVVSGTASAEIETQFMRMNGVDTLSAPAASTAEERIDGVEISLILDVSGSMNSNSKLANLKVAARDFVDEMVNNTEEGKLSISIVPYATQVSVPSNLMNEFNVSTEHSFSNCINFEGSDFYETSISTTDPMQRTMHFDPWYTRDGRDDDPVNLVSRPVCESDPAREVMPLQNDADTLKTFITNLTARGNTSIDVGMKWGTALLDPGLQPVVDNLIADGTVPAEFDALPYSYTSSDSLKVVVLMTDGKNTSQYYINDGYRTGASNIWWNEEEEEYSVYDPDSNIYYWRKRDKWADHPFGQDGWGCVWEGFWDCQDRTEAGDTANLSYPELWAYTGLRWNVKYNYEPWMNDSEAWNDWYYPVRNYVGTSTKNTRTHDICEAAKDQQIIVFTIGFEAPSSGEAVLKDCASSASHFYDVDGLAISDAFASIASSIRKLRLTQ